MTLGRSSLAGPWECQRAGRSRRDVGLWEVRSNLAGNRIARIIFCINRGKMILLHGFIKKTGKTSDHDLDLAMKRKREVER